MFVHWRIDPLRAAALLPSGVVPDTYDGSAWIGLVPFVLSDFRFLPLPAVPGLGTFNEINIRTYGIDAEGRRGVVFQTLEAEHLLPVLTARAMFGLPYRWAQIGLREDATTQVREFRSRRRNLAGRPGAPRTQVRVQVSDRAVDTELSRFLTARWGFHERHLGRTLWAANEHERWPLVDATLLDIDVELLVHAGLADLAMQPPDSVLATPWAHSGFVTRFAGANRNVAR